MFERLRSLVLRCARVPHEPSPPAGAPGSVRVFRAGENLYKLRLAGWALSQFLALGVLLVSFGFLLWLKRDLAAQNPPPSSSQAAAPSAPPSEKSASPRPKAPRRNLEQRVNSALPNWVFPVLTILEVGSCAAFLAQLLFSYTALRLEYELRWYIVTDRSLRIRTGLLNVQEATMSFANLQQVVVTQGPVQRLLRVADVRVQSAGGGSGSGQRPGVDHSLHTGVFHGVDNAPEIRDLILERLRQFRAAGLGDPEDHRHSTASHSAPGPAAPSPAASDTVTAAQALLAETRALRHALTG